MQGRYQAWWHMSIITALGRPRQENHKFKASTGYIETLPQRGKQTKKYRKDKSIVFFPHISTK
jgi:hypothetical protein